MKTVLLRLLAVLVAVLVFAIAPRPAFSQQFVYGAVPAAPSALWINVGASNLTLHWNRVPGASTYYIYRGTASGAEGATEITTVTTLNFTDTTVTPGTTYYYKVAASYGSGAGSQSAEASGTAGASVLGAPLMVVKPTATGTALVWTIVPGATFYEILRYTNSDGYQRVGHVVGNAVTNFADNSGILGNTYQYKVVAGGVNGVGQDSNNMYGASGDTPAPAPTGIWAVPGNGYITVNWNRVPGATGFIIYRSTVTGGEGTRPFYIGYSTSNYVTLTCTNGVQYFFTVACVDNSGVGLASGEATATAGSSPPTSPLIAGYAGAGANVVRWSSVSGAIQYRLFRDDSQGNLQLLKVLNASTLAASDTAVTSGYTYRYTIAASNANGTSGYNNSVKLKAGSGQPDAPSNLFAYPSGSANYISWNYVPGTTGYNVYRGTSTGNETLYATNITGNYYNDYGATSGIRYFYKVKSVANQAESALSAEVSSTVGVTRLPSRSSGITQVAGKITINIGAVPGATSYTIFRSEDGGNNYSILKIGQTAVVFTDTTAHPYVTYYYYVCGVNADGMGLGGNYLSGAAGNGLPPAPASTYAFANSTYNYIVCEPVQGAASYNVYRSTTTTMPATPYASGVSYPYYYDYSATPGTRYYYAFTAVDPDGEGLLSPLCSAKAGSSALPGAILTLNQATTTSVSLNWTPISTSTGYDIFRSDDNSNTFHLIVQNNPSSAYTDTGLTSGITYNYYVMAVGLDGLGSRSNTVQGVPGSTRLPAPVGVAAQVYSTGSVYLHWNQIDNVGSYNIYRSTSSNGQGAVPIYVGASYGYYYDYGLADGVTYYYKVTATDFHGQSLKSAEVSVKANSAKLAAPSITVTAVGTTLQIDWAAIAGATSYNVYRAINGVYSYPMIKTGVGTNTFTDDTVIDGVTYTYYVTAVSPDGEGSESNYASKSTS